MVVNVGAEVVSPHYSFIPPEIYPPIANTCSLREILEFQNTHVMYSLEVEEFESKEQNSNIPNFY